LNVSRTTKREADIRGTFVGTPLYVSPEMLTGEISGPFTDLWALGLVIYFIATKGEVPWKSNLGGHQYQLFEEIKSRHMSFPNSM